MATLVSILMRFPRTLFVWGNLSDIGTFFLMAISLLPYVSTFSEQFYFWKSYFLTLFQSNCLYTEAPFSEQSLLSKWLFFQNRYYFRAKLLPSNHSLRIESSWGKLLFGIATFLLEDLLRITISTEELLFPRRYFSAQQQLFQKSYILEKVNFSEKQYSALPTFSGELPF